VREQERRFWLAYVSLVAAWGTSGMPAFPYHEIAPLPRLPLTTDSHLRSMCCVRGYQLLSRDEPAGTIEDFVLDDEGRCLVDLVVRRGWLPHRGREMISSYWVTSIDWDERCVRMDLTRDAVLAWSRPVTADALRS
jgi:hypothetical protein